MVNVVLSVVLVPDWRVPVYCMASVTTLGNSGSWTSAPPVCVMAVQSPATHHLASTSTNRVLLDGRLDGCGVDL